MCVQSGDEDQQNDTAGAEPTTKEPTAKEPANKELLAPDGAQLEASGGAGESTQESAVEGQGEDEGGAVEESNTVNVTRDESFDIYGDLEKDNDAAEDADGFLPDDTGFSPSGTPRGNVADASAGGGEGIGGGRQAKEGEGKDQRSTTRTVIVRGMQWWTSDSDLEKFFVDCGEVTKIDFQAERATGKSLGVASVEFADSESAAKAVGLNEHVLDAAKVAISLQVSRPAVGTGNGGFANVPQSGHSQHTQVQGMNSGGGGPGGRGSGSDLCQPNVTKGTTTKSLPKFILFG